MFIGALAENTVFILFIFQGQSAKGQSATGRNTMVFVVLKGEVTVVIHSTQFVAKKGDSFYVPPKNSYNLININTAEAELSILQYQYDGPLYKEEGQK